MDEKKNNLTPERKAKLKSDVLAELDNQVAKSAKKVISKIVKKVAPIATARLASPQPDKPSVKQMRYARHSVLPESKAKASPSKLLLAVRIILMILILFILTTAISIFGIYKLGWENGFNYYVAKTLYLPAGTVAGEKIKAVDYFYDKKILTTALTAGREGVENTLWENLGLEDKIFNRLAILKLMEIELKGYNQPLTNSELNEKMAEIVSQFDSDSATEETTRQIYSLSLNQFKNKVLRFVVMKDRLQGLIVHDNNIIMSRDAKARAEEILTLALQPNVDFATLAGQYTEDEAGIYTGGDTGWINQGELDEQIEEALFALSDGVVYDQLIVNDLGYHIFKVEQKLTDPNDGRESIRARHILISVDIDEYLRELLTNTVIVKYL